MNKAIVKVASKSPLIFSIVAVVGVVATAVSAVRDYKKASKLIDELVDQRKAENEERKKKGEEEIALWPEKPYEKLFEQAKITWTKWIPTAALATSTIAAIVLAHRVSASQLAAVSAAAALGGKKLSEQKWRLKRLIGADKYDKLESFISGKVIDASPIQNDNGLIAFHEQYSGEVIYSTLEDVIQAEYDTNKELNKDGVAIFFKWMSKLAPSKKFDNAKAYKAIGWSAEKLIGDDSRIWVDFKNVECTSPDGKKYYEITYPINPVSDYISNPIPFESDAEEIESKAETTELLLEQA